MARLGDHHLTVVGRFVDDGQRASAPVSLTDDPFGYLGRQRLDPGTIAQMEAALGESAQHEPGMVRVGAAWASLWWPHLVAALAAVVLWGRGRRSRMWSGSGTRPPAGRPPSGDAGAVPTQIGVLRVREAPGDDDPSPLSG